jgi:nucleotide-binding universal stress UspA family protein
MLPLSKILVPVDFSERSAGAVRYAASLACHFHAELVLLHVVPPISYESTGFEFGGIVMTEAFIDRVAEARKELMPFMADELGRQQVERIVLEGDPARKIVEFAHNEHVSLIVMPTHGYGPFRRFLLGSVTAKVLHDADCLVLTGVHLEEGPSLEAVTPRTIICAVDLGPQSAKALQWASQLAGEFHAELVLVHATPLGEAHFEEMFDPEWRTAIEQRVREKLDDLLEETKTKAEVYVEDGNPADVVTGAAQRFDADLVVIGRSEAAGMFGRLRTNAYSVIRQSPCPVVSV